MSNPNETIPGGAYLDGERYVDANGQELKSEQVSAFKKLTKQHETDEKKAEADKPDPAPVQAATTASSRR